MLNQYKKSEEIYEYAKSIIPGGVQASRKPLIPGRFPIYAERGEGCYLYDVDGNRYIDYCPAWGPMILGWCYKPVDEAAISMIRKGVIFTQNHPLQNELAERLIQLIPSAEMCTFMKTGSDATSAALKIARCYTGREKVIRCGYHGWHDWATAEKDFFNPGVPKVLKQYVFSFDANHPEELERLFQQHPEEIAAVIIAPEGDPIPIAPDKKVFARLRDITQKNGAVFILDEVKTFPRVSLNGMQQWLGVTPDLSTVGKAIGNGHVISAVEGKKDIMMEAERAWISATFNGDTPPIAAALKTLEEMERLDVVDHLWSVGEMLMKGLNDSIKEFGLPAEVVGWPLPPMPFMRFTLEEEDRRKKMADSFCAEMAARGILLHPLHLWFISYAHKEKHITRTLEVARECMKIIQGQL